MWSKRLFGAFMSFAFVADASATENELAPRQLLAALHTIQDNIASGDRSALPLQTQMIAMLDASFAKLIW